MILKLNKYFSIWSFQIAVNVIGLPVFHEIVFPTNEREAVVQKSKFL